MKHDLCYVSDESSDNRQSYCSVQFEINSKKFFCWIFLNLNEDDETFFLEFCDCCVTKKNDFIYLQDNNFWIFH